MNIRPTFVDFFHVDRQTDIAKSVAAVLQLLVAKALRRDGGEKYRISAVAAISLGYLKHFQSIFLVRLNSNMK